jgi:hypothetical protein
VTKGNRAEFVADAVRFYREIIDNVVAFSSRELGLLMSGAGYIDLLKILTRAPRRRLGAADRERKDVKGRFI